MAFVPGHLEVTFAPGHAAMGGMLLGLAAATQMLLTGRLLGISGTVRSTVMGLSLLEPWRQALLVGLALTALPLALLLPSSFASLPESYTYDRAVVGGLLSGLGTSLGGGCTSGHGICGLSMLSPRSLVFTLTFMAAAAGSAIMTDTYAATGINTAATPRLVLPDSTALSLVLGAVVAAVAGFVVIVAASARRNARYKGDLEYAASFLSGGVFAVGLAVSGMTLPSKVAGFLTPGVRAWDPSLAFVMGAALCVTCPVYQHVRARLRRSETASNFRPHLLDTFSFPLVTAIDARLLLGGVLFGAGWGLCGICPGPGVVSFFAALGSAIHAVLLGAGGTAVAAEGVAVAMKLGAYALGLASGMVLEARLPLELGQKAACGYM